MLLISGGPFLLETRPKRWGDSRPTTLDGPALSLELDDLQPDRTLCFRDQLIQTFCLETLFMFKSNSRPGPTDKLLRPIFLTPNYKTHPVPGPARPSYEIQPGPFEDVSFEAASFEAAFFEAASCEPSSFDAASFEGGNFERGSLERGNFEGQSLEGGNF